MKNSLMGLLTALLLATTGAAAQDVKWRHGTVEPKGDAGFIFMIREGGFAKKRGLDLEISTFKGDAIALKALIAGELDSYEGNPGGPMIAASKGADVKVVARNGQTTVDMANGPVQRISPFLDTVALLEGLGAKNNHKCMSC